MKKGVVARARAVTMAEAAMKEAVMVKIVPHAVDLAV